MERTVRALIGQMRCRFGLSTTWELLAAVQDPTNPQRASALDRLGWPDSEEIQAQIIEATRDADPAVHDVAMLTLLYVPQPRPEDIQEAIDLAGEPREPARPNQTFTPQQEHIKLLLRVILPSAKPEKYDYAMSAFRKLGGVRDSRTALFS